MDSTDNEKRTPSFMALKMETACFFEMSVFTYKLTWHYDPEDKQLAWEVTTFRHVSLCILVDTSRRFK